MYLIKIHLKGFKKCLLCPSKIQDFKKLQESIEYISKYPEVDFVEVVDNATK